MAEIIQQGAAMLDDVEAAVYLCRTEPHPSSVLAKTCGSLVSSYLVLSRRLRSLRPSALSQRVAELLSYHLELTGQASMLAFRPHDSHWDALAKGFGEGLGEPAQELRRLARGLRHHTPVPTTATTTPKGGDAATTFAGP